MESRFADPDFAKRAYTSVIRRTLDYGVCTPVLAGDATQTNSRK